MYFPTEQMIGGRTQKKDNAGMPTLLLTYAALSDSNPSYALAECAGSMSRAAARARP